MLQEQLFAGPGIATIRNFVIAGAHPRVAELTEGQLRAHDPDALAR